MTGNGGDLMRCAAGFCHPARARFAQPMKRTMWQSGRVALQPEPFPKGCWCEWRAGRRNQESQVAARCRVNGVAQLGIDLDVNLNAS